MYQAQNIPQQLMQQPAIANPSTPLPPQVPPGWAAHWDQSQQKFYFHNSITGTVTWDYPRQNALPTSSLGSVHYPPQQQQMQGFDPLATPAPQYQQYQHPANIPVDPTAVGQPQPQQHQQQQPQLQMHHQQEPQLQTHQLQMQTQQQIQPDHLPPQTQAPQYHLEHRGEEYGGEKDGGEEDGSEEDGSEEDGGEGYDEYAGGGGFDYSAYRLANDLYMKGLMNARKLI